jgi:hypothetical protein
MKKRIIVFLLTQPSPAREGLGAESSSLKALSCWGGLGEEILKQFLFRRYPSIQT